MFCLTQFCKFRLLWKSLQLILLHEVPAFIGLEHVSTKKVFCNLFDGEKCYLERVVEFPGRSLNIEICQFINEALLCVELYIQAHKKSIIWHEN